MRREKASTSKNKEGPKAQPVCLPRWTLVVLAVAAAVPFLHTIRYDFVYDDYFQVLRNPLIREWSNLGTIFTSSVWQFIDPSKSDTYYRPLHMTLHMLGYKLSGLTPHAYHGINILLHALCTIWAALIAFRLARDRAISLAAGLIFGLHPIHAESITWIAAVTDPSCAFFYFGALYFYIKDAQGERDRAELPLFLGLFFFALLSKEMAFTLPPVVVFLDWILLRKLRWSRYLMITGVVFLYFILRVKALGGLMFEHASIGLGPMERLWSMLVLLSTYIVKMFVPYDMSAFHVFTPTRSPLEPEFLRSLVVLGAYGGCLWFFRSHRALLFVLGFSLLALLPVLNPNSLGDSVFADRYLYIPTLGSSILLPLLFRELWKRRPIAGWTEYGVGVSLLGALLLAYGVFLWDATTMWRNNEVLYTETLKKSPHAMLISNNLGRFYLDNGDHERARKAFQSSLEIWDQLTIRRNSLLVSAYAGLGGTYLKLRQLQEAKDYFTKALELAPRDPVILDNLGSVHLGMGEVAKARGYYERALALNPNLDRIYNNLAVLHLVEGKFDEAILMAEKALRIFPNIGESYIILGKAYAGKGMLEKAREHLLRAAQVDPTKSALVRAELAKLR